MNRTWCALLLIVFSISSALSQTISKTWEFQQNDSIQQQRFGGASELHFNEGKFSF